MANTKILKMRISLAGAALAAVILVQGCSSLLPTVKEETRSNWASFEETKAAYDEVVPYETSADEFRAIGFAPPATPNVKILTYLDVLEQFLPNSSIAVEDLPQGVRACFEAQADCHAYELDIVNLQSERYGDVVADLFNFRRKTHKSGWTFKALFVVVNEVVVYKLWSGNPLIDEKIDKKNPLGPLQQSEDILRSSVVR
jgi:hypothetical protein